jgi:HAD superfamily hydrolase (TIGR01509 family)
LQTIEAVLFDNDGVLVDTETLFYETSRSAFKQLGLDLTRETWAPLYLGEGKSSREIALSLGADPARIGEVLEERNRQYLRVLERPPPLLTNVRETLASLRGRVKMAIVTGCSRDQLGLIHASSGILSFFDTIVTSNECSNAKPHPEPYLNAIATLGVNASRCIAVEDSPRGLASARAADVPCVIVPTELTCALPFPGALAVEQDLWGIMRHIRLATTNA